MGALSLSDFRLHRHQFNLANLSTEQIHPLTIGLSDLCKSDLAAALEALQAVDLQMLQQLSKRLVEDDLYMQLKRAMERTIQDGRRVFILGFGSAGRMSVLLEATWRRLQGSLADSASSSVVGIQGGGDLGLIQLPRPIEDSEEEGRQFLRLEFPMQKGDLAVVLSEGGETPFTVGMLEAALEMTQEHAFYLFCNREHLLYQDFERLHNILTSERVVRVCLDVGPMAIAGSTRMQSCSVLLLFVGLALFDRNPYGAQQSLAHLTELYRILDLNKLLPFILQESQSLQRGEKVFYRAEGSEDFLLTLLIDLAERIPTFACPPLGSESSWFGLSVQNFSWKQLLQRSLRSIEEMPISIKPSLHTDHPLMNYLTERQHEFSLALHPFLVQCCLKMLLNLYSTATMGLFDRIQSNLMLYVRPNNFKLIDRCVRIIETLLQQKSIQIERERIETEIFAQMEHLAPHESIVLKCLTVLSQ